MVICESLVDVPIVLRAVSARVPVRHRYPRNNRVGVKEVERKYLRSVLCQCAMRSLHHIVRKGGGYSKLSIENLVRMR
jgi:hypothetical protein